MSNEQNPSWADEATMAAWAEAHNTISTHSPHVVTAILAQQMQKNHGMHETEAWGEASHIVGNNDAHTLTAILAEHYKRGGTSS